MARFTSAGGNGSGAPGPQGPRGPEGDSAYDVAVANGFVGTEQEWLDSFGGTANIADFVFNYDDADEESTITIHNHDMVIRTTRDGNQDSDISLTSADDIWITSNDTTEISSVTDDVVVYTNDFTNAWRFQADAGLRFPDSSVQNTAYTGMPQGLSESDSPSFDQIFVTNNDGTGQDIKVGDDAWIGDVNQANHIAVIGNQDPTVGGIVLGNGLTEKISSDVDGNLQFFMDGSAYIGNVESGNRIATMSDVAGGGGDLVVPFTMKDTNGADLLAFEKGGTGVTRINALQDDLALRSARDIILYPGDDGPGNVYINWGDATIAPNATNRVATIADIQAANTGDITFVNNTISSETGDDIVIQNKTNSDVVTAKLTLNQNYPRVAMEALNDQSDYFSGQWSSATWSGNSINFVDATNIINYFSNTPGNITGISVNGGTIMSYEGANFGEGTISLNVNGTPASDPETVNEMIVYYTVTSKIDIDYDNGSYDLVAKGMDINIRSDDDVYITAEGDDLFLRANDDVRFTSGYNDPVAIEHQWRMNSEGKFELPGNGYISNPNATVVTPGNRTVTYADSYLNDQSGIIDQNAVSLPVDVDSTWFANNINTGIFTSPAVISFADGDSTNALAIYDATSQGTPAVIFLWNDANRTKTFEQIYPLSVSVNYTTTTYDGTPTIVLDPADNGGDQFLVIDATAPNHIHLRTGGAIDNSSAELFLGGEDTHVRITDQSGSVEILGTDITISSYASPSSLNINTYNGAVINSNRTSTYADADKVVATLGDLIPGIQGEPGTQGATGRGFRFMGEWNDIATYVIDDVVTFQGESYIAILGSTVEYPPNTMYWTKIAAKGADASTAGDSGWIPVGDLFNSFIAGSVTPGYRKLNGVVHVRGSIYQGTAGLVAFTLPEGFRPDYETVVLTQRFGTSTGTYVTVLANGEVVPHDDATWLSGISFIVG